jgi:hypothetical protein
MQFLGKMVIKFICYFISFNATVFLNELRNGACHVVKGMNALQWSFFCNKK